MGAAPGRFPVLRAPLTAVGGEDAFACIATDVTAPTLVVADPVEDGLGWTWLVAGTNCAGTGALGLDSLGAERMATEDDCP